MITQVRTTTTPCIDYVLTSGCSWTDNSLWAKDGNKRMRLPGWEVVDDSQIWPAVLAKKLDLPLVNLGKRGRGNQYIFDSIIDNLPLGGNPLVCVLWTEATRIQLPNNKEIFRPQYVWSKKYSGEDKLFWNMLMERGFDIDIVAQHSWRLYSLLEKLCILMDIPYIAGQGMKMWHDNHWKKTPETPEGLEMMSFWKDMHELHLVDNTGHPSIKGHEYIAEEFYKQCTF